MSAEPAIETPIEGELVDDREPAAMVRYDPSQLLGMAIEKGLDITTLERLMDLQERWEKNRARAAFFDAKARFQALVPEIPKQKQGYGYLYAPMGDIERAIGGPMGRCGLSKTWQQVEGADEVTMTCVITHIAGHSESSSIGPVKWNLLERTDRMNGLQHRAAVISYLQRYTLISALGLATADDDTDGDVKGKGREEKSDSKVTDQIRQPRRINKEQAKRLTEIVTSRGIPTEAAAEIVHRFGFASGPEITVDKLGAIMSALNEWQPQREPGDESENEPPVQTGNDWRCSAANKKRIENKIATLMQLGAEPNEVGDVYDARAGTRDPRFIEDGDVNKVLAALDALILTKKKK